jgi:hypothetical protein
LKKKPGRVAALLRERQNVICWQTRCRSGSSSDRGYDSLNPAEGDDEQTRILLTQIAATLLPAAMPLLFLERSCNLATVLAPLAIAAGACQAPALTRAALRWRDDDWLRGRHVDSSADDDESEVEEGERKRQAAYRIRFNCGIPCIANRLLELTPRAVPDIVLY